MAAVGGQGHWNDISAGASKQFTTASNSLYHICGLQLRDSPEREITGLELEGRRRDSDATCMCVVCSFGASGRNEKGLYAVQGHLILTNIARSHDMAAWLSFFFFFSFSL